MNLSLYNPTVEPGLSAYPHQFSWQYFGGESNAIGQTYVVYIFHETMHDWNHKIKFRITSWNIYYLHYINDIVPAPRPQNWKTLFAGFGVDSADDATLVLV
jgi:hypothetical protein